MYICLFVCLVQKPVASLVQRIRRQSSSFLLSPEQLLFSERSKDSLRSVLPEKYKAASKTVPQNSTHMAHSRAKPQSVEILESTAPEDDTELPPAPSLRFGGALKEGCVLVVVPVDTLALVRWDSTLGSIAQSLKDRICAQLEAIKEEMLWKVRQHSSSSKRFIFYLTGRQLVGHIIMHTGVSITKPPF